MYYNAHFLVQYFKLYLIRILILILIYDKDNWDGEVMSIIIE